MQYLDYSYNAGAIEDVIGIGPLYQSIRGREFSRKFSFNVGHVPLNVSAVQLEVDSGLEGRDAIVLIEAKVRTPSDFNIRQLFYPYRHFGIVSPEKNIIPVFFTYNPADGSYKYWIYKFTDQNNYNSIALIRTSTLHIRTQEEIELSDIRPNGFVKYVDLIPQANDLNKVVEFVYKVDEGFDNHKSIAAYFGFAERQSGYYREAAEALGLVTSENGKYHLTMVGRQLASLPAEKRNLFLVQLLSEFSLVKECLGKLKETHTLTRFDIESLIQKLSNLTGSTVTRRAYSMIAWLRWIASATGSFVLEAGEFKSD